MRHILWSTWNEKVIAHVPRFIAESRDENKKKMADCWWWPIQKKIKPFMMIKKIAIEFVDAQQMDWK